VKVGSSAARTVIANEAPIQARAAGLAYLITIACGMFAEVYVRTSIRSSDPASTSQRLVELEQLYRIGILADGIMLISYVIVTALLYRLFKPVGASVSVVAALFSVVGIAILAASMTILLIPIADGRAALAYDALRLHGAAYNLTGLFFGPYCALIGWLVLRSRWLPTWIGWLMVLAGAAFCFDASIELVAPALAQRIPEAIMLISLIAEGALAIWLAMFGVRARVHETYSSGA
jgi:hypothetical protein